MTVLPILSICMYCATNRCEVCVPMIRDRKGVIQVVCECNQREHADRTD